MRHLLRAGTQLEHGKKLGARINRQPEPQALLRTPEPGAQLVQLEVGEPEMAEGALVQSLCMRARTRQKGS